jgi:xylulokinase
VPFKRVDIATSITSLPSGIPGRYFVATEQDIAGGCLTMFRDQIFWPSDELSDGAAPEDALDRFNQAAARIPPGSDRLIFTPWLNGERTPVENHTIRGGFFNQSLSTTRAHMVRAVFEGVALNTRWMHETVEKYTKRRMDNINFIGGGANSPLWSQIHADVLDRRIRGVKDPRFANVRGAAFTALVALGYLTFDQVPERIQITSEYEPNPDNRAIYDELFAEFVNIYQNNKKAFARLNARH